MSLFDLTTELPFSLKAITTSREKKIIIILQTVKDEFTLEGQSSWGWHLGKKSFYFWVIHQVQIVKIELKNLSINDRESASLKMIIHSFTKNPMNLT